MVIFHSGAWSKTGFMARVLPVTVHRLISSTPHKTDTHIATHRWEPRSGISSQNLWKTVIYLWVQVLPGLNWNLFYEIV